MLYLVVLGLLFAAFACSLWRAARGPAWYDRVLAVNTASTKTILLIAVYLGATGDLQYIDIALLYALLNYVTTLAVCHYLARAPATDD